MTSKPGVHCELHPGNSAAGLRLVHPSRCRVCDERQGRGTFRCGMYPSPLRVKLAKSLGHIFCRDCVNQWAYHQSRQEGRSDFTCPACRKVQNRCNRDCCYLEPSFFPYKPDHKPSESTEMVRKRVIKVAKAPAQNVNHRKVHVCSIGETKSFFMLTSQFASENSFEAKSLTKHFKDFPTASEPNPGRHVPEVGRYTTPLDAVLCAARKLGD
jgi:hypothetical protein